MALHREYPKLSAPFLLKKDERGKPFLENYPKIHINISHSGEYVACAIGAKPVGVDIEQWKDRPRKEKIVEKFHLREQKLYFEAEEAERERIFFDSWVLKESFGKALGKGLGVALSASCMEGEREKTGRVEQALSPENYYWHLYEMGEDRCSLAVCSQEKEFVKEPIWLDFPEGV